MVGYQVAGSQVFRNRGVDYIVYAWVQFGEGKRLTIRWPGHRHFGTEYLTTLYGVGYSYVEGQMLAIRRVTCPME